MSAVIRAQKFFRVRTYVPLIRTFLNPIDPNGYRLGLASDDSLSVPWGFGISWDKIDAASKDVQNYGYQRTKA